MPFSMASSTSHIFPILPPPTPPHRTYVQSLSLVLLLSLSSCPHTANARLADPGSLDRDLDRVRPRIRPCSALAIVGVRASSMSRSFGIRLFPLIVRRP